MPGLPVYHQLLELAQTVFIKLVMPSNHPVLCRPLLFLPEVFPSIRVFSSVSVLCIRWPKLWSFSFNISPYNEYSGLISLGLTGLISLQSKGLKSLQQPQFKIISSLALNFLYGPTLTPIHDCWIYMNVIHINKRNHQIT